MDQDTSNPNWNGDLNSQNIFDEFSESQAIGDEVQKIEKLEEKDAFFYIKKGNSALFLINLLLFISIIIALLYSYIQTSDQKKEYSFLAPVCSFFLWNIPTWGSCYGARPILTEYENQTLELKEALVDEILPLLWDMYSIENFNLSKKVLFLLEKSNTRLRPLEIVSAFDELKWKFSPTDKKVISCYELSIHEGDMLEVTCDVFSSDWDNQITVLKDDSIVKSSWGGTSVSHASSFVYFLEHYSDSRFQIIEKPKFYSREETQEAPYTQRTTIQLKMKYNSPSSLTF